MTRGYDYFDLYNYNPTIIATTVAYGWTCIKIIFNAFIQLWQLNEWLPHNVY